MSATAQQKDFTHLSAQSVQTIAEAFGIVISDDVAKALAPDVVSSERYHSRGAESHETIETDGFDDGGI